MLRLKRVIDVVGASALLILSAPVLLSVAVITKLVSPGPLLFRQQRLGLNSVPFEILKIRTMYDGAQARHGDLLEEHGGLFIKVSGDSRITPFGRYLRRFSVDELPQLLNVINGDMSLVGPRPITYLECERLPEVVRSKRHSVPPGLTGLWQISGRSTTTDEERVRLDLQYVDRQSILLDLKILLKTLPAVLRSEGAE
jgi:lipopolysaccharide/colanic/teichoic acid biosynthesis glycosyltransferase